jgi:hypothetical protein
METLAEKIVDFVDKYISLAAFMGPNSLKDYKLFDCYKSQDNWVRNRCGYCYETILSLLIDGANIDDFTQFLYKTPNLRGKVSLSIGWFVCFVEGINETHGHIFVFYTDTRRVWIIQSYIGECEIMYCSMSARNFLKILNGVKIASTLVQFDLNIKYDVVNILPLPFPERLTESFDNISKKNDSIINNLCKMYPSRLIRYYFPHVPPVIIEEQCDASYEHIKDLFEPDSYESIRYLFS